MSKSGGGGRGRGGGGGGKGKGSKGGGHGGHGGGGGGGGAGGQRKLGKSKNEYQQRSMRREQQQQQQQFQQARYSEMDEENEIGEGGEEELAAGAGQSLAAMNALLDREEEMILSDSVHASVFATFNQYLQEQERTKTFTSPASPPGDGNDGSRVRFRTIRTMSSTLGLLSTPHGSVKLWQGDTCVVCAFFGPSDVRISKELPHRGVVDVLYRPKVTGTSQYQSQVQGDTAILEERSIETIITNIFESVIYLDDVPAGTGFNLVLHEYENDGCLISACINATTLAILDGSGSLRSTVASVTAIISDESELIIDPNSEQLQKGFSSMFIFAYTNARKILYSKVIGRLLTGKLYNWVQQQCLKSCEEIFLYFENRLKIKHGIQPVESTTAADQLISSPLAAAIEVITSEDDADHDDDEDGGGSNNEKKEDELEEIVISSGGELEDGEINE